MENATNDKLGTLVIDGKIYNLDTMTPEELESLEQNLRNQLEEKRDNINKLLKID